MGWAGTVAELQYNGMPNIRMVGRRTVDAGRSCYPYHASDLVVTTSSVPKPNEVTIIISILTLRHLLLIYSCRFYFAFLLHPSLFQATTGTRYLGTGWAGPDRAGLGRAGPGRALCWGM